MTQRRLDILTTGGTIAYRAKGPMATGDELAAELSKELQELFPGVEIRVREICRRGSSQMTTTLLWKLAVQVNQSFHHGADGVVITHGTDTLEETAYFLDLMADSREEKNEDEKDEASSGAGAAPGAALGAALGATPKAAPGSDSEEPGAKSGPPGLTGFSWSDEDASEPVTSVVRIARDPGTRAFFGPTVVTGAMRGHDAAGYEGMANLIESCQVALEPDSAEYGVLVVMNDKIHLAREVTKAHSWLLDAFVSPALGPVGYVGPQGVAYTLRPPARSYVKYTALLPPVDLVTTAIESGDRLVRALIDAGTRGLVVESLGHGNLPPGMAAALCQAVKDDIPVVITTRCLSGGAPNPGTVDDQGFIATDLNGPKARIKLMLALSVTNDPAEIAGMFAMRP